MNKDIKDYIFLDCILIDFETDKLISNLSITIEAYFPLYQRQYREKGILKIAFKNISKLLVEKSSEFEFDILQKYDKNDNHVKANEIYNLEISSITDKNKIAFLKSDMLKLEISFEEDYIEEVIMD